MKYYLSAAVVCFLHACSYAQVIITPQLPAVGLVAKSQLWNLSLVNSASAPADVAVEIQMTDQATGQTVLSGISRRFHLGAGVKNLQPSDVMPVNYTVVNSSYNVDPDPNGFLPVGVFSVCFTVLRFSHGAAESITNDCQTIEVEPLSPPLLSLPGDEDSVEDTRPLFTWLPPSPSTMFRNLRYDWTLVTVHPFQSPAEAIQQNIPLLSRQNLSFSSFQYPASVAALDTGVLYAWKITAKSSQLPIANSEVWSFRVKQKEDAKPAKKPVYYVRLSNEANTSYAAVQGRLRFEYNNPVTDTIIRLALYDITRANNKPVAIDSSITVVKYGMNYEEIDLAETPGVVNKHLYLLKVTNDHQQDWYLKFTYIKPE